MSAVSRAVRARAAAVSLGADWVWPYWLERQIDPSSPSFVPGGHLPRLANVAHRNWTAVGNVGSRSKALVDPRGLVTPWPGGWSLDWWIGADDRWHFPSREVAVRQRLVGDAPVVETAMAVPGGDAVERVYAVQGGEELVVVEIENRSRVPFAVGLAVRPYNPEGIARVERITLHDRVVHVDGRAALLFPKPPVAMAGSTSRDGDSALVVTGGTARPTLPEPLRCDAGLAQAAFLFPLAHTATLRVALPLVPRRRTRRRPELAASLASAEQAARGWAAHARRGLRLELPDERLSHAVEANRRYLLLFHGGSDIVPGPATDRRYPLGDGALVLAALDRYGFHAEAAEVIASLAGRRSEPASTGAALWAMAEHWRLTGDLGPIDADVVSKAVRAIDRARRSKGRRTGVVPGGPRPAGSPAECRGPFDHDCSDSLWSWRGLLDGARLLHLLGRERASSVAEGWAAELRAELAASMATVAGDGRGIDPGVIGSLVACWPLGLFPAEHPAMAATTALVRERLCIGDALFEGIGRTGLDPRLTVQLALVELEAGDRRALDRLRWLLDVAMPTFTWPAAVHPQLGSGCAGDGHDRLAAAGLLSLVRNLLVREVPDGIAVCSMLPDDWAGRPIEVHDAPTRHGRLSFAVRWHGERPALLWELEPHPGAVGPVRFSAPGLDRAWSSTQLHGDALLAPSPLLAAAPKSFS